MAFDSIFANKLRSFLTMLGIIIGISSVISIVSLGQGGQNTITGEFEKIGAATVNIKVNSMEAERSDYFTLEDVIHIKEKIPYVKYASPVLQRNGTISSRNNSRRAVIIGGSEDITYIQNLDIMSGRFYNNAEYMEGKAFIVIDDSSARKLFGTDDVVGMTVDIGTRTSKKKATVIGVIKSQVLLFGENENVPVFVYMPATFMQQVFPNELLIDTITVVADSKDNMESAGNASVNLLKNRRGNRTRDVYKPENVLRQLDQINNVLGIFTAFISAVAAISLLVGGIGVMNIMLVSVTERTREIGIRKAIGAKTRDILFQFLTESVIIACIGGVIGLLLGIAGAYGLGSIAGITPKVSAEVVVLSILFSSAVGMFFGIYPAQKAAKLDPIEALRYE